VLSATAPSSVNHRRSAKPSIGAVQGSDAALSQGDGPSPATAVIKALTGSGSSGGLGPLLPIILAAAALAVCAVAISRRRRTS
jgi:hypothetical protein